MATGEGQMDARIHAAEAAMARAATHAYRSPSSPQYLHYVNANTVKSSTGDNVHDARHRATDMIMEATHQPSGNTQRPHHLNANTVDPIIYHTPRPRILVDSFANVFINEIDSISTNPTKPPKPTNNLVCAPYEYALRLTNGSKPIIHEFIKGLNFWFSDAPQERVQFVRAIMNTLIAVSSMLHDIRDGCKLRYGQPATHTLYGVPQTINSATYMITKMFQEAQSLNSPGVMRILNDELENIHCGQSLDLHWSYHLHVPFTDDYDLMVDHTLGAQLRMCLRLMEASIDRAEGQQLNLGTFTCYLARYFQILDDYLNITSKALVSATSKGQRGFCSDLDEGKMSFPLVHCLHTVDPEKRTRILGVLMHKGPEGLSVEMRDFILRAITRSGALEYTRTAIMWLHEKLVGMLGELGKAAGDSNMILARALDQSFKLMSG